MLRKTPLHPAHLAAGARMMPFAGWHMPLHYGSQIEEHHAVRRECGMFDVSHMLAIDVAGAEAPGWLRRMLANDAGRLTAPGRALYSCMLNERGGVIDDLLLYRLDGQRFRMVVNASNRDKDLEWLRRHAPARALRLEAREDLALIAVQGPRAVQAAGAVLGEDLASLPSFHTRSVEHGDVARTGYTGEDGVELMLAAERAPQCWQQLREAGAHPCGLGARDTLRLEAGLCLYGQDLDEDTSPLESGLAFSVAFEPAARDFIGREALQRQRERGVGRQLTGLLLEARGVLRAGARVFTSAGEGQVTSGGFAPTLERSIALARVPAGAHERCEVEIRGRRLAARSVQPPFVRRGCARIAL